MERDERVLEEEDVWMRDDDVSRLEMSDLRTEREADVFVSEREMREVTEIESEFPEIFMSVTLSVPSV